eukprot:1053073_1
MATSMEKSDAIRPIPNYSNVFGDKATIHDLEHIFDILNETNDDRIISRDFNKIVANVGLKLEPDELKTAYNHIAASVDKKSKAITKESWCKGIHIAHEQPNTHKIYKSVLGGGQYNPQKKRKEISLADIQTALKDTKKSPWLHRIACMESLCRQLTTKSKKMTTEKFHNIFRVHHIPLIKQAKDRRSNVMRVACEVLSKIIMRWGNVYLRYANSTITYIYELVRLKIFVVHITGCSLLSTLFKHCADHKEYKMMHLLGDEAVDSKFQNLQKDCFDLLLVYFQSKKNEKHKKKDEFYQGLMGYVVKGVEDADEIRNSAMTLLAAIESEKPKLTKPTIKKMNVHLKKRYEEEYRTKKKKKRKKRFEMDKKIELDADELRARNMETAEFIYPAGRDPLHIWREFPLSTLEFDDLLRQPLSKQYFGKLPHDIGSRFAMCNKTNYAVSKEQQSTDELGDIEIFVEEEDVEQARDDELNMDEEVQDLALPMNDNLNVLNTSMDRGEAAERMDKEKETRLELKMDDDNQSTVDSIVNDAIPAPNDPLFEEDALQMNEYGDENEEEEDDDIALSFEANDENILTQMDEGEMGLDASMKPRDWSRRARKTFSFFKRKEGREFSFNELMTPHTKRNTVVGVFYELLVFKNSELVDLKQDEPFGDITITKTDNFYRHEKISQRLSQRV